MDYPDGSLGKSKTNPTDIVPNKYFTIVTNYIMENKNIQQYLNDIVGQDGPFQDMDEGERRNILLTLKNDDFTKVTIHTSSQLSKHICNHIHIFL